jgi:hypothetical protein
MALPRPLVLAILGIALIGVALVSMTRVRTQDEESGAPSPAAKADQPAPAAATSAGEATSGKLSVRLTGSDLAGIPGGDRFRVELSGIFQGQGQQAPPKFDFDLDARGGGERFRVGAVSLGDRAFVRVGGDVYRVPEQAWSEITGARTKLASQAGTATGGSVLGIDPSAWLAGERTVPGGKIDGVPTLKTSGRLDVAAFLKDVAKLSTTTGPAIGETPELSRRVRSQIAGAIDRATVEYNVGKADGVLRRARVELRFTVPSALRDDAGGLRGGRLAVAVDLTGVNQPQQIAAPARPKSAESLPSQDALIAFGMLGAGTVAIDAPPAAEAALAQSSSAPQPASFKAGDGLPGNVARALSRGDVVVLLLTQPDGGDDAATRESVRVLRRMRRVTVVADTLDDVGDYSRVVGNLGISQAPATVIVRPDGKAQLVEGYIDAGSLAQQVLDAAR